MTGYFRLHVMRKRPYIKAEWLEQAQTTPLKREVQSDGRVRTWIHVEERSKYLRVVFLADGETVHNAFFDRRYKGV